MDARGSNWESDQREQDFIDGNEAAPERNYHHQYYCDTLTMGGVCSCQEEDEDSINNNHYSGTKKTPVVKDNRYGASGYHEQEPSCQEFTYGSENYLYSNYSSPYDHKSGYPGTSDSFSKYSSREHCQYCNEIPNMERCEYCSDMDRMGVRTSNEESYSTPKIQVKAKILFGTVGAITNLKQKKSTAKKS